MLRLFSFRSWTVYLGLVSILLGDWLVFAEEKNIPPMERVWIITGVVQYEDLRHVSRATVELRNQEGTLVDTQVTNDGGEFIFGVPESGIYSIRANQASLSSESAIVKISTDPLTEVMLTLASRQEITLDVVAPLPPIQHHASSETFTVSRKDIEELPRGNNAELHDILLTLPSAVDGGLGQVHIRQEHAGLQFRIDGVPIPDTVSSVFSDVLSPRTWERADIILGGPEAQFGNRTTAVLDVTTKAGRILEEDQPNFWRVQ